MSLSIVMEAVSFDHPEAVAPCADQTDALACRSRGSEAVATRTLSFVQVHQDMERVSEELQARASAGSQLSAAAVAAHMQAFLSAPGNVGAALAAGVMAVQRSLPLFTAEPQQITRGVTRLGTDLFDAVAMMLPEETRQSQAFIDAEARWDDVLQKLPSAGEELAEGLRAYKEDGDVSELVTVCAAVIKDLEEVVTEYLPEEVSANVAKFITALLDAVEGFDEAMEAFKAGNTTGSVEAMYVGIRTAAAGLLPEGLQDDENFKAVVDALDSVFDNLSSTVLRYQQAILKSSVCWKASTRRERERPDQCPEKTKFNGKSWCAAEEAASLLDTSARRKGKKVPGSAPACADDGDFGEQRGAWCYKPCPAGTRKSGWGHTHCKSTCVGAYPIDSLLMCGKSPGTIRAAMIEMTIRTIRTVISAKVLIESSGFAAAMPGTATSLVDLGTSFAHPNCPALEV